MDGTSTRTRRRNAAGILPPALLTQPQAWAFVGLTRSGWFAAKSAGLLPAPVYVATSPRPRWRRADLEKWVAALPTSRREATDAMS